MKNKILLALLGIAACIGCKQHSATYPQIAESTNPIHLAGTDVYASDDDVLLLLMSDESLIASLTMNTNAYIKLFRIDGDKLFPTDSCLSRGQGPYEVSISPTSNQYVRDEKMLCLFDGPMILKKLLQLNIENNKIVPQTQWQTIDFPNMGNYVFGNYQLTDDNSLLAVGGDMNAQSIFSTIDLAGNHTVTPLNFWPEDGVTATGSIGKFAVYFMNAHLYKHPARNRFLYVCDYGKYMELVDVDKNVITKHIPVSTVYPKYTIDGTDPNGFSYDSTDRNHGFLAATSSRNFFVSPKEYNYEDMQKGTNKDGYPYSFGEYIDMFDWEGQFVKRYKCDQPFLNFVINESQNAIYTSTMSKDDKEKWVIRKYSL